MSIDISFLNYKGSGVQSLFHGRLDLVQFDCLPVLSWAICGIQGSHRGFNKGGLNAIRTVRANVRAPPRRRCGFLYFLRRFTIRKECFNVP